MCAWSQEFLEYCDTHDPPGFHQVRIKSSFAVIPPLVSSVAASAERQ